jgi:Ni,Fe-hydrogenase III large subunit
MRTFNNNPFGVTYFNIKTRNKKINTISFEKGYNARNILKKCKDMDIISVIPFIERIEQSSHNHYSICFCDLIEKTLEIEINEKLVIIRTIFLELERIYSHILFINRIFFHSENNLLFLLTAQLNELFLNVFEEISGHRIYHTSHTVSDLRYNLTQGNLELIQRTISNTKKIIKNINDIVISNPSLSSINQNICVINNKDISDHKLTGPISWGRSYNNDLRIKTPYFAYKINEIQDILSKRTINTNNCSFSRLSIIIEDINCSLDIINILLQHNLNYECSKSQIDISIPTKKISNKIETPRGTLTMNLETNSENKIINFKIVSPSEQNQNIVNKAMRGTLVDNKDLAFESLYLSLREIEQ